MKATSFEDQISAFSGPVGFVYYMVLRQPKYKTLQECKLSILSHLDAINKYDNMQLHGAKSELELTQMAESSVLARFKADQESKVESLRVAIDLNDYSSVKESIESAPGFISWGMPEFNVK